MANTHISAQAMRSSVIILFYCVMSLNGSAQVRAEEILGHWLTEKGDAHVLIYIERDMYVGKIVWVKDEKQSAQLNTVILADFVYDEKEKEWNSGTVFEPRHGHKSSGYLVLKDANTLKVTGYKGFRWISDSEIWTRVKSK